MAEVLGLTGATPSSDIATPKTTTTLPSQLEYVQYSHDLEEKYLPSIRALISKDLSEPYSIYVYRYFLCQWAHLCFMVCWDGNVSEPMFPKLTLLRRGPVVSPNLDGILNGLPGPRPR